jgi:HSP20 family protein
MAFIRFYNTGVPCYRDENSNEAYDRLIHRFNHSYSAHTGSPSANISETEKQYNITMALPGVNKNDIHIQQEKGYLTVNIDKGTENKEKDVYTLREFDFSGTSRSFRIGDRIDKEKITATCENGILTLHLPKKEDVPERVQSISIE